VGEAAAAAGAKTQFFQLLRNLIVAVSLRPPRQNQGRGLAVALLGPRVLLPAGQAVRMGCWGQVGGGTQLLALGLEHLQGPAGALADHVALLFRQRGEDVHGELVGLRLITGHELYPRLHQRSNKSHVAREPVELGNDEHRSVALGQLHSRPQLRPRGRLTAFHFHELPHHAFFLDEAAHHLLLRRQPESALALL